MKALGCLISLGIAMMTLPVLGQGPGNQEYEERPRVELPKREKDWVPSVVFLSYDMVSLVNSASSDRFQGELNAKIDFDEFYLAVDYGWSDRTISEAGFEYDHQGSYFRIGPEVNFMPYNKSRSQLFAGLKYAWSRFDDQIDYQTVSDDWSESNLSFSNRDIKAWWLEANFGLNVRIVGPFYMGYVVRFKFSRALADTDELVPYEIPGYGRADRSSTFGFSYYLTYRFGFRNKPVPQRPEKAKRLENTTIPTKENE